MVLLCSLITFLFFVCFLSLLCLPLVCSCLFVLLFVSFCSCFFAFLLALLFYASLHTHLLFVCLFDCLRANMIIVCFVSLCFCLFVCLFCSCLFVRLFHVCLFAPFELTRALVASVLKRLFASACWVLGLFALLLRVCGCNALSQ